MSPALPEGEVPPADGSLPAWLDDGADRSFGVYVHVPFCTVRCGYCDFNTYTASELLAEAGGRVAGHEAYAGTVLREVAQAARALDAVGRGGRPVSTVFVGGGTPTLLPAGDLVAVLDGVRSTWGLSPGAEVTTEANPDSVTPESLAELADGGFTRVSFGMQSAVPHVLATLERTHDPERVPRAVEWARDAGLAVSLDLIYGTPGESVEDWRRSLDAVVACGVDHVSAYALTVEEGTKMAAQVRRGVLPRPDPDDQAAKYELADDVLTAAGLGWYEISNWARTPDDACRHNVGYWRGDDWWGFGPGAHSHLGGAADGPRSVRWWNVKHPRAYADRLAAGATPAAGRELLGPDEVQLERVLLGVRIRDGLPLDHVDAAGRHAVAGLVADGLLDGGAAVRGTALLTRRGRLLADAVVRALTA
ncbi:coproporphyrinogen III oxidase [Actinotalea ferrariae]|uniref:radical SAM family heme chaperone HemW n=1 Tax=Actinotalea ferrariae TaxID=1386098 RepID=UPI001C8CED84|nr:radical SAM family heme chaperone HemW [Actinotalea ferrariae]MBX9247041.1 coproporphyrinogen III oxidase [Actinotalea ferrariae]